MCSLMHTMPLPPAKEARDEPPPVAPPPPPVFACPAEFDAPPPPSTPLEVPPLYVAVPPPAYSFPANSPNSRVVVPCPVPAIAFESCPRFPFAPLVPPLADAPPPEPPFPPSDLVPPLRYCLRPPCPPFTTKFPNVVLPPDGAYSTEGDAPMSAPPAPIVTA